MSTLCPEKPCGVRRFIRHPKRFFATLLTALILSLSGIVLAVHLDENFELEGDVFDDWMGIIDHMAIKYVFWIPSNFMVVHLYNRFTLVN